MNSKYKFLIAGGANTAITFALYALMVNKGINYNLSLAVTYAIGIILGFFINRLWTFAQKTTCSNEISPNASKASIKAQFGQYVLVYLLIFSVNFLTLNLLVQIFKLNPIVSQLFAVGLSTICSYALQKTWVFKHKDEKIKP